VCLRILKCRKTSRISVTISPLQINPKVLIRFVIELSRTVEVSKPAQHAIVGELYEQRARDQRHCRTVICVEGASI
jgi:hypothetical protein